MCGVMISTGFSAGSCAANRDAPSRLEPSVIITAASTKRRPTARRSEEARNRSNDGMKSALEEQRFDREFVSHFEHMHDESSNDCIPFDPEVQIAERDGVSRGRGRTKKRGTEQN